MTTASRFAGLVGLFALGAGAIALAVLALLTTAARADDAAARKVRVAVALTAGRPDAARAKAVSDALGVADDAAHATGPALAPAPRPVTPCVCGGECRCEPGRCPTRCPVAPAAPLPQPPAVSAAGPTDLWRLPDGRLVEVPRGTRPAQLTPPCPDCPR